MHILQLSMVVKGTMKLFFRFFVKFLVSKKESLRICQQLTSDMKKKTEKITSFTSNCLFSELPNCFVILRAVLVWIFKNAWFVCIYYYYIINLWAFYAWRMIIYVCLNSFIYVCLNSYNKFNSFFFINFHLLLFWN